MIPFMFVLSICLYRERFIALSPFCYISVELDHQGRLISLTKEYEPVVEEALPDERLLQIALQFTEQHYPNAPYEFVFHEKKVTEQFVRFTYVQTVLDLPLPQTGFYVRVAKNGEVIEFRYNGGTSSFSIPKQIADKLKTL